jgi:hypothetical protein
MKKLLILAYDFPPFPSVGGLRPQSWLENMHKFGVYPIVVTRQWENNFGDYRDYISSSNSNETEFEETKDYLIIKSAYKPNLANRIMLKYGSDKYVLIRKIVSAYYEFLQFFINIGPKRGLMKAANTYLLNNRVDAIIATGDPFVLFKYANNLSKKHNISWYADYRDDWIQNHTRSIKNPRVKKFFLKIAKYHENRYLKNVSGITSVSDYLVSQISNRTGIENVKIIENGADLNYYKKEFNPFNVHNFNILYSGMVYDFPYLDDFCVGFEKLLIKFDYDQRIKVHFLGTESQSNQATQTIEKLKQQFPNNVEIETRKSPKSIAQYQLHANVLLNLIAGDPEKGLIGAKSYNYAVTRNPILTIPQIKNKKSPFFPDRDIQYIAISSVEVEDFLLEKYLLFLKGIHWQSSLTESEKYLLSREYNAEKLAKFIFNY